jgi:phosphoheptose isomerase
MRGDPPTTAGTSGPTAFGSLRTHLRHVREALGDLERQDGVIERWAGELSHVLHTGGRLLAAGNGGSAAEAQHLTAELVGRFEGDRAPLSAIALHAETSSLTAIVNDFGPDEVFARQAQAHGRPGDLLMLFSTSGHSRNLLCAAQRGREVGLRVWALTGGRPNPLADLADDVLAINSPSTTAVQEAHLVAVHALCATLERRSAPRPPTTPAPDTPATGTPATRVRAMR